MSIELKGLLDSQGVPEPVATHIEGLACLTVPHFAAWVDELDVTNSIKEEFLRRAPSPFRKDRGCVAKLKCAWQIASAGTKLRLERSSRGLHEENWDAPLTPRKWSPWSRTSCANTIGNLSPSKGHPIHKSDDSAASFAQGSRPCGQSLGRSC